MGISLTAEQREMKDAAAAFARAKLNKDLVEREAPGEIPVKASQACATPLLLETRALESLSRGGGRG